MSLQRRTALLAARDPEAGISHCAGVLAAVAARRQTVQRLALATQATLATFIDEGLLARHIRKVAPEYAERHAQIVEAIERRFGPVAAPDPGCRGPTSCSRPDIRHIVDITHVVRRAEERGVRVSSLSDYDDGTAVQSGLVIGYGAIATARIDEGMKRLAASFGVRIRS